METVKTFVFFDLETTGLPQSNSPTKITEISLVAAGREHILEKCDGVSKENNVEDNYLPRVLNKINFTIYPCKMIHPAASAISVLPKEMSALVTRLQDRTTIILHSSLIHTWVKIPNWVGRHFKQKYLSPITFSQSGSLLSVLGLTNDNLENQKPFDDNMFNILQLFMDRLEKPVCLVAHNGNLFDFPILQSELGKIGKQFPEDVFCVDSLPAFREILSDEPRCEVNGTNQNSVFNDIRPLNAAGKRAADLVPKCGFSQEDYDFEMIRTLEVSERVVKEYDNFNPNEIEMRIKLEMEKLRKANETTPVRKQRQGVAQPIGDCARRNILNEPRKPKQKFTLGAVYERVTKKELANAHRAENDALALLECVTAIGLPVMRWMDSHKIPFREIRRLW